MGFCRHGWNGLSVIVSLAILEKGCLTTIEGPKKTIGTDQPRSSSARYSCAQEASTRNTPVPTIYGLPLQIKSSHADTQRPYSTSTNRSGSTSYNTQYSLDASMTSATSGGRGPPPYASTMNKYPHPYQIAPAYNMTSVRGDYPTSPSHYSPSYPATPALGSTTSKSRSASDGASIFLTGFPYHQSESELRNTLATYGHLVYLEIHPDNRESGKGKGTARARFQTPHQALGAIRGLDGRRIGGRKISVTQAKDDGRFPTTGPKPAPDARDVIGRWSQSKDHKYDKSRDVVAPETISAKKSHPNTGPLVVNGARGSVDWRDGRDEGGESDKSSDRSSDESSEDSSDDEDEEVKRKLNDKRGMC